MSWARSRWPTPSALVRPLVLALQPYVPGEQPKGRGLIKLNTNENPYPPAPEVLAAIQAAVDGRLRLYPHPTSQGLRERLARFHGCRPENVFVGNGSDEVLALAVRAFVEPAFGSAGGRRRGGRPEASSRATVQFLTPSYSLYPVLAESHGAVRNAIPLAAGFALPALRELRQGGRWDFQAALTLVTTPNAPTGRGYTTAELAALCEVQQGLVLLDEAYVDFAQEPALSLALRYPHVLVARTFSKAYSLCFQRVGYAVGHADLIAALDRLRDSYNVNGLGQVAALATLRALPHYRANFARVRATRERVTRALGDLGFEVCPSQTNFIFVRPPRWPAQVWLARLRERKVLVRWFRQPETRDFLRISIGTDAEMNAFLRVVGRLLRAKT